VNTADLTGGKYMGKTIRFMIVSIALLALSLAACACTIQLPAKNQETTAAAATDATTMDETLPATSADATVAAPTATPSPTSTPAPTPDANLSAILDQISNMEEGTAGSSFKRAAISGELLDWIEDSSLTQAGNEIQVSFYLESLPDAAAVDLFVANFESVSVDVQSIIDGDASMLGMLLDSGYTLGHASYTQAKWDSFADAVQDAASA